MRVWYMVRNFALKTSFASLMSRNVMGHRLKNPASTCPFTILSTIVLMFSSVYSLRLLEAASTESAIIRIACYRVCGFGPGYVKRDSSTCELGNAFLYEM